MLSAARLNLIQVHRQVEATTGETKRVPMPSGDFRLLAGDMLDVIGESGILSTYEIVGR